MNKTVQEALNALRELGSVAEMRSRAAKGCAPASRPKTNSHIHLPPNFSAFESVAQAVGLADEQDVRVVGVTNYYDYGVYGDFVHEARGRGIFPLFGLEIISLIDDLVRAGTLINDPNNPGRMYLCGKGGVRFEDRSARAEQLLNAIRRNDTRRMAEMADKVAAVFAAAGLNTRLDEKAIVDMICTRHGSARETVTIQERHIAMAFQQALFRLVSPENRPAKLAEIFGATSKAGPNDEVAVQGEIRTHLMKAGRPAFVKEEFLCFEEAYEFILEVGGIPCYPTLADGTSPICEYEAPVAKLIENLRGLNVHMAEYIPIRNTPEVLAEYVRAVRAAGMCVVGGTEHNTLSLIGIEPTCLGGAPVPEDIKEIFWEGMCVGAAHEFLTLHGEIGFVDAEGNPNRDYDAPEARIEAFAKLGAAVIQTYFEKTATRKPSKK
jgi:hypothetical protein